MSSVTHLLQDVLLLGQSGNSLEPVLPGPPELSELSALGLPSSFSSLYICLMNISISQAQLFPLNKQSADFIAGLLLTYLFRALNHSQETLGKVKSGILAMGPSCQHLLCRARGVPSSHKPAQGGKEAPIIQRPEAEADNTGKRNVILTVAYQTAEVRGGCDEVGGTTSRR